MYDGELEKRFSSYTPEERSINDMKIIRKEALKLAQKFNIMIPDCREKSSALTKLEEFVFHANAGISRSYK